MEIFHLSRIVRMLQKLVKITTMDVTTQITDYSDDSLFLNETKLTELPLIKKNPKKIDDFSTNFDEIIKWASRIELQSLTIKDAIDKGIQTWSKPAKPQELSLQLRNSISKVDKNIAMVKTNLDSYKTQDYNTFALTYKLLQYLQSDLYHLKQIMEIQNKTQIECNKALGSLFTAVKSEQNLRANEYTNIREEMGELKQSLTVLLPLVQKILNSNPKNLIDLHLQAIIEDQQQLTDLNPKLSIENQQQMKDCKSKLSIENQQQLKDCNSNICGSSNKVKNTTTNCNTAKRKRLGCMKTSWVWSWFVQDSSDPNFSTCDYCQTVVNATTNIRPKRLADHLKTHNLTKESVNYYRSIPIDGYGKTYTTIREPTLVSEYVENCQKLGFSCNSSTKMESRECPTVNYHSDVKQKHENAKCQNKTLKKSLATLQTVDQHDQFRDLNCFMTKATKRRII